MIERWRQQPAAVQDLALAVLLGVVWFGTAAFWEGRGWRPDDEVWDLAGATSVLVLALRRIGPAPVLVAGLFAYAALYDRPLQTEFHLLPVLVLAYAAARRPPAWAAVVAVACLGAAYLLATGVLHEPELLVPGPRGQRGFGRDWSGILFVEFAVAGMVLLGVVTAAQRRTAAVLATRNAELERLRTIEAEQAVALERTRIARELHDDIAHHLTALIVRAQAAERVAGTRPEVAVESLGWFAETARYALTAMRRTVTVLRDGDAPAQLAPGPSLDDLPDLVGRVREAGLDVTFELDGQLPALEPQVQHAVVRVVQESLTNVLRHSGARAAVVSLAPGDGGLTVVVEDDGRGPGPDARRDGGHGLVGMRERAATCGGRLDLDRGRLGGWRVRAWFPLEAAGARP